MFEPNSQSRFAHCACISPQGILWCHSLNCFKVWESFHLMVLSQVINIISIFSLQRFIVRSQQWKGSCFVPPRSGLGASLSTTWLSWCSELQCSPGTGTGASCNTLLVLDKNRIKVLLESRNLCNSTQLSGTRANLALSSLLWVNI